MSVTRARTDWMTIEMVFFSLESRALAITLLTGNLGQAPWYELCYRYSDSLG